MTYQKNTDVTWNLGTEMKEFVCGFICDLLHWKYITCIVHNVHESAYIYGWFKEKINWMNKTDLGSLWQTMYIVNDKYMVSAQTGINWWRWVKRMWDMKASVLA
jgi:hypothetical protein